MAIMLIDEGADQFSQQTTSQLAEHACGVTRDVDTLIAPLTMSQDKYTKVDNPSVCK